MSDIALLDYGSRDAWLAARNTGVGASESAALFGLSPWDTAFSLWTKKTGRVEPDEIEGEWVAWGNLLEEPIARRYEQKTGRRLWQGGPYCVAQHPEIPFMRATPDRFVIDAPDRRGDGLLQIKNTNAFKGHDWDDGVPDYIQVQVQHEMACTGRAWASVAVLIGGAEFRSFDIERDESFIGELEEQVRGFWVYVERDEPPPIDGSIRTLEAIKKLHPKDSGATVPLPPEATDWWEELASIRAMEARIRKAKPAVEAKLFGAIGDATYGTLPDGRVLSLKTTSRDGYEVQPTTYRSLRLEKGQK
ncbi:MAG TPA: YqaJ viral recombinase family protein [Polyangia bacterium]|nr:YqaJ viral recombinase family protein [Polyangia bacterium]